MISTAPVSFPAAKAYSKASSIASGHIPKVSGAAVFQVFSGQYSVKVLLTDFEQTEVATFVAPELVELDVVLEAKLSGVGTEPPPEPPPQLIRQNTKGASLSNIYPTY